MTGQNSLENILGSFLRAKLKTWTEQVVLLESDVKPKNPSRWLSGTTGEGAASQKEASVHPSVPPTSHQTDWHPSGSQHSQDKTIFGFVTPRVCSRKVWFSLSIDSEIKSGPLLSLRQAIHLDTLPLRTGLPKCYVGDSNLLGWDI